MMKISTVVLLALLAGVFAQEVEMEVGVACNASHFDFTGQYTLGKQDELNRTFVKIQEKIPSLGNVTFNTSETTSYTIFNTKPVFFYRDSAQKASINGNDTIVVYGGKLEADLTFQWTKKTNVITRNGTGAASGLSDMISFAKTIVIANDSFYSYELLDAPDVTWSSGEVFQLTRIDPADASDDDKAALTRMLNNIMQIKTIRNLLEEEVDRFYNFYLRASLHDEHQPVDNHFDYVWAPIGKPNITIPFTRRPVSIDIEKDGIQLTFEVQAANATQWTCGKRDIPFHPINPNVYGHTQQFISLDFYENVLRHAVSRNWLDTTLNKDGWESRMFQFYAGDLYEVFPLVQDRFYASEPVEGSCKATYAGLKAWKASDTTFNVSLHFDCELTIVKQKIVDFAIGLQIEIEGVPRQTTLDFRMRSHEQFVSIYPYGDFKVLDEALAKAMVSHSLNRLYDSRVFGSGWPQSPPRDYPHFMVEEGHTVVYDSTHVNAEADLE